ncbi:hypothetical protein JZ751_004085 [Albula glossodonta]|uniref:Carbohydrate sulfotransferase n=1 Tax=Albula glossodonta TaxID=121402 RepID=A0A8T2P833_9TELE|nr:hypothetical protein JZ751_004085 [Albula glossodonta]
MSAAVTLFGRQRGPLVAEIFQPKARPEHSLKRRIILPVAEKKSNGSKNMVFEPFKLTPSHADAILVKRQEAEPQQTSLLKQVADPVELNITPRAFNQRFLQGAMRSDAHKEQERRKSFLQNFCKKFNNNSPPRMDLTDIVSRIYVEERHKILYCEVPKAGCSNWKRTLMVLNGLATSTDKISHDAVHYGSHLKKLDSFDRKGIQERLSSFTKVVVVRDPMERLVSAFRDKFEQPNPYYHPVFGRAIIRKYRENATKEALQSGSGVTFGEFVHYLLDAERPVGMDIHWESVSKLCFPCFITYDFIGKFETLEQDANYFLGLIGAPGDLKFPSFKDRHSTEERTTPSVVDHYILQLSPTERQRIYDFFYLDYFMFNYTKPYSKVNVSQ